jgi:6-phosphofructokinase
MPLTKKAAYEQHQAAIEMKKNTALAAAAKESPLVIGVGGGPAGGIPWMVASIALSQLEYGGIAYGSLNSLKGLASGKVFKLTFDDIWDLQNSKFNPLGTARFNPKKDEATFSAAIENYHKLGAKALHFIGGNDSAELGKTCNDRGIPLFSYIKTIDNDWLHQEYIDQNFGFDTAATLASYLANNLSFDAWTLTRYFFTRIMGRTSGSLALEVAKRSGAIACFIPEQFKGMPFTINVLEDAVRAELEKRSNLIVEYHGLPIKLNYGNVILSEGLEDLLIEGMKARGEQIEQDNFGNPILNLSIHAKLADLFKGEKMAREFKKVAIQPIDEGYVLRTAEPTPLDQEIVQRTGKHGVKMFLESQLNSQTSAQGYIMSYKDGKVVPVSYNDKKAYDQKGKMIMRLVNTNSQEYKESMQVIAANAQRLVPEEYHLVSVD